MLEYKIAKNKMRYEIIDVCQGVFRVGTKSKYKEEFAKKFKIECFQLEEVIIRKLLIEKLPKNTNPSIIQ